MEIKIKIKIIKWIRKWKYKNKIMLLKDLDMENNIKLKIIMILEKDNLTRNNDFINDF